MSSNVTRQQSPVSETGPGNYSCENICHTTTGRQRTARFGNPYLNLIIPWPRTHAPHTSRSGPKLGLRTSYSRFLGFLARESPDRLRIHPVGRVDRQTIAAFVDNLRHSYSNMSIAIVLQHLRQTLYYFSPDDDFGWLKLIAKRIGARAQPRLRPVRSITSYQLY
jgi:hypothetical protein